MEQIKSWTDAERESNRCTKCQDYFHSAESCKNPGPCCFNCNEYGHLSKKCPKPGKFVFKLSDFLTPLEILADGAASHHVTNHRSLLFNYVGFSESVDVSSVNPTDKNSSIGQGDLIILFNTQGKNTVLCIRNVLYMPTTDKTLISCGMFNEQFRTTIEMCLKTGSLYYRSKKKTTAKLEKRNNIFYFRAQATRNHEYGKFFNKTCKSKLVSINCTLVDNDHITFDSSDQPAISSPDTCEYSHTPPSPSTLWKSSHESCKLVRHRTKARKKLTSTQRGKLLANGLLWHKRLGHISAPYVNRLPSVAYGVEDLLFLYTMKDCEVCALAKMKHKPFNTTRKRGTHIGEIVHADLIGEISPVTRYKKKKYILLMIDDFSKYKFVKLLQTKDETPGQVNLVLAEISRQNPGPGKMGKLRSDHGGEFSSAEMDRILAKYNMDHDYAEPECHQHNDTSERGNLTLEERMRALLRESGFPSNLWNYAANAACYLYNCTSHSSLGFITPFEKFHGTKPNLKNLFIFGCKVMVLTRGIPQSHKLHDVLQNNFSVGIHPQVTLPVTRNTQLQILLVKFLKMRNLCTKMINLILPITKNLLFPTKFQ